MQYFPLFLDLTNKAVLVVGGGEVACRKIDALLRAGARVTIVSPQIEHRITSYNVCYTKLLRIKVNSVINYLKPIS